MKFLAALFLCCVSLGACIVDEKCNHQRQCDPGECCVQVNCITPPRCKHLRKEGELCVPNTSDIPGLQPFHRFACPCVKGAQCEVDSAENTIGDKVVYNYRCQQ